MPGASHLDRPVLPHVSIPTTYSGAELTPFFGMTDPATRQKQGAGGPTSAPVVAIYDPELTASTPPRVLRRDGHERAGPLRGGGVVAAPHARGRGDRPGRRAHDPLAPCPPSSPIPDNASARAAMLEGRRLAGRCLLNAGMGVHHGLAQLVGGRTGIPHGLANAILLTHAIALQRRGRARRGGPAVGARSGADAAAARRRAARRHRPARAAVRGRRGRGRPRGGGPAVAVERQRRPQPAPGARGRRAGHPPGRVLTSATVAQMRRAALAPDRRARARLAPAATTTGRRQRRPRPVDDHRRRRPRRPPPRPDHHRRRAGAVGAGPAGRRPRRRRLRRAAGRRGRRGGRRARRPRPGHRLGAQLQLVRHLPGRADPGRRVGRPRAALHRRRHRRGQRRALLHVAGERRAPARRHGHRPRASAPPPPTPRSCTRTRSSGSPPRSPSPPSSRSTPRAARSPPTSTSPTPSPTSKPARPAASSRPRSRSAPTIDQRAVAPLIQRGPPVRQKALARPTAPRGSPVGSPPSALWRAQQRVGEPASTTRRSASSSDSHLASNVARPSTTTDAEFNRTWASTGDSGAARVRGRSPIRSGRSGIEPPWRSVERQRARVRGPRVPAEHRSRQGQPTPTDTRWTPTVEVFQTISVIFSRCRRLGSRCVADDAVVVKRVVGRRRRVEALRREGERLRHATHPGVVSIDPQRARRRRVGAGAGVRRPLAGHASSDRRPREAAAIVAGVWRRRWPTCTRSASPTDGSNRRTCSSATAVRPRLCGFGDGSAPAAPGGRRRRRSARCSSTCSATTRSRSRSPSDVGGTPAALARVGAAGAAAAGGPGDRGGPEPAADRSTPGRGHRRGRPRRRTAVQRRPRRTHDGVDPIERLRPAAEASARCGRRGVPALVARGGRAWCSRSLAVHAPPGSRRRA